MENNDNTLWVDARMATLDPPEGQGPGKTAGLARLRAARVARRRRRLTAAVIAVAGCVCLAAFPGPRVFAQRCLDICVAQTGQLLWPGPAAVEAPDFTLPDSSGESVRLSSFRGKVVLLNFWATWCSPCKAEIPMLDELQRAYGDRGLVVLGVSLDDEGWGAVRPFLAQTKVGYRVMVGHAEIARLYGNVESLPATLLIDRAGRVAATHTGLVSKETYERELRALLQ